MNLQTSIKFFIVLILFSFTTSCKKDKIEESRPKTFSEFESIVTTDRDFTLFISSSIELEDLSLSKFKPSLILKAKSSPKFSNPFEKEELKKVKSFDEMRSYLNKHQIENADKIVDLLEKQSISFANFLKKYPEYSHLSTKEKEFLITNSLKNNDKSSTSLQFNNYRNQGQLMVADGGDPMQAYGIAIQGCQNSYRTAFTAATAAADVALLASLADPTGIAYASAVLAYAIAIYYIDEERGNCMNLAANLLFNELN